MNSIVVAPSILAADFLHLERELRDVLDRGADWLHLDVMDGHFVPNLSFGIPIIAKIRKAFPDTFLDTHLMISNPDDFMDPFIDAGCDQITFHIEASRDPAKLAAKICEKCKVGISIKPKTPVADIAPYLDKVDMILVMTVEPGFGGQSFMGDMMGKIKELREDHNFTGHIQVDGGINPETARISAQAGADVMVAGSAVFKADDRSQAIDGIKNCLAR